jgi:hypothetical protein
MTLLLEGVMLLELTPGTGQTHFFETYSHSSFVLPGLVHIITSVMGSGAHSSVMGTVLEELLITEDDDERIIELLDGITPASILSCALSHSSVAVRPRLFKVTVG